MNKNSDLLSRILILGACGHVGKETVIALSKDSKSSEYNVRAGVKNLETDSSMMDSFGIEAVQCDLSNEQSVELACKGVQKLFLILPNAIERVQLCKNVVNAAKKANIQHMIFLSIIDSSSKDVIFAQQYKECEQIIEKSGIPYTNLRSMFFQENIIALAPSILTEDVLKLSIEEGKFAPVCLADVGESACNVLLDDRKRYLNQYFDLTGPQLLSGQDIANVLTKVSGKEITFTCVSIQEMTRIYKDLNYSEFEALGLSELYHSFSKNEKNYLSKDIELLLGRKPTELENTLNSHKSHLTGSMKSFDGVSAK